MNSVNGMMGVYGSNYVVRQEESKKDESMLHITPYAARYYAVKVKAGVTTMTWDPCQVIGIDASTDEPKYLVEIRGDDGSFYIEKADLIRKEPR